MWIHMLQKLRSLHTYVQSIKLYAQEYADHAVKTYNSVERKRYNYIHKTKQLASAPISPIPLLASAIVGFYTYSWVDDYSKEHGSTQFTSETASKEMQKHINKVAVKLTEDYYDPKGIAAKWHKLVNQPLAC